MRVIALALFLSFALVASAAAHVTRIPHRCKPVPASRLCAIHWHHDRTNQFRVRAGQARLPYLWRAEAHPARRTGILTLWIKRQRRARRALSDSGSPGSVVGIIEHYFGPAASQAISVASCESHLDPRAHNASGASGLFQLMPIWWQGQNPYDPVVNTRIAHQLYERSGWSPWSCQP